MAKIITVTANTAIDFVVELNGLALHDNIQAISSADFVCGKGINAARAVASAGCRVVCSGFVGRQSLERFQGIQTERLRVDFTEVAGKTRTNFTLFDHVDNKETHIRTAGYTVTSDDCKSLVKTLESRMEKDDIVIFSGSLPGGAPTDWYRQLIELCHGAAVIPFLDSSGTAFSEGLKAAPYLVKPNLQELEAIAGRVLTTDNSIIDVAAQLTHLGVEAVFVSLGRRGVIALSDNCAFKAEFAGVLPNITSTIGSGDVMVAALALAKVQGLGLEATLKFAVGCATANTFTLEPGRFAHEMALKIAEQVTVTKI